MTENESRFSTFKEYIELLDQPELYILSLTIGVAFIVFDVADGNPTLEKVIAGVLLITLSGGIVLLTRKN